VSLSPNFPQLVRLIHLGASAATRNRDIFWNSHLAQS